MTDTHSHDAHHGPGLKAYLVVATALAIFTAVSFIVNQGYDPIARAEITDNRPPVGITAIVHNAFDCRTA